MAPTATSTAGSTRRNIRGHAGRRKDGVLRKPSMTTARAASRALASGHARATAVAGNVRLPDYSLHAVRQSCTVWDCLRRRQHWLLVLVLVLVGDSYGEPRGAGHEDAAKADGPARRPSVRGRYGRDLRSTTCAGRQDIPGRVLPGPNSFRTVALAFDAINADTCISRADLTMPGGRLVGTGEIRVYPSAALSLAHGRLPPNGGRPTTLLDNRPFGFEIVHDDRTRTFNVTELVELWAAGGTFPSKGRWVPKGSPIVLLLRPPGADDGTFDVEFDVVADPPTLTVSECGGQ